MTSGNRESCVGTRTSQGTCLGLTELACDLPKSAPGRRGTLMTSKNRPITGQPGGLGDLIMVQSYKQ